MFDVTIDNLGGVGIPAGARIPAIGGMQDVSGKREFLSLRAMDFHPDFDAFGLPVIAQFAQTGGDVLNRSFDR